jgi:hypothetical protein
MQLAAHSTKAVKDLCEHALAQAVTLGELLAQLESYCQQPDFARRTQQLLEVSSAIDKLERKQIPIPQDLRRLKSELLAQADNDQMVHQTFITISQSLAKLAATHEILNKQKTVEAGGAFRSKSVKTTPFKVLRGHLLTSLQELGGSAPASEVLDSIESKLQTALHPGDLQPDTQGVTTWRKNVRMLRHGLAIQGVLRSDSPRGIWQLAARPK